MFQARQTDLGRQDREKHRWQADKHGEEWDDQGQPANNEAHDHNHRDRQ